MNALRRFSAVPCVCLALVLPAPPARADEARIYTEDAIPDGATLYAWGPGVAVQEIEACATPEGIRSQRTTAAGWGGWGIRYVAQQDLAEFQNGAMRFWVRTPVDLKIEFTCSGDIHHARYISSHGWNHTDDWQEIQIPICDFFSPNPCDLACLGQVEYAFMVTAASTATFSADYVRWYKPPSRPGRSTVQVSGREFHLDGRPFSVKGVDYSPTPPSRDYRWDWSAHPERYMSDFPLMRDLGLNAIRTYRPLTRSEALDAASAHGLHVIQQFTVEPLKLTCPEGRQYVEDRFAEMVSEWKDHPAILIWLIGNEVNASFQPADWPAWYQLVDAMAGRAHAVETEVGMPPYHPVTTANSDMWGFDDVCADGVSDDAAMPNLDLWSLQAYRDCAFGLLHGDSVFDQYAEMVDCARPLLMSEFGCDAWDSAAGAEATVLQQDCIASLLDELQARRSVAGPGGVGVGGSLFEWQDEWWKSTCAPGAYGTQDTCVDWWNPGYADQGMNEEWWGLCRNWTDASDRTFRPVADAVARRFRLGEASGCGADGWMTVTGHDRQTGTVTISYRACPGASDHTVHYGPLSLVAFYAYSGMECLLGATGSASFTLPEGSFYWLIVGNDGTQEGCYGTRRDGTERPPDPNAGPCALPQSAVRDCGCP